MELTPQLLDEQEFPVVLRGYDTDAVDDFLERVGAGVAALIDRVEQARARMVSLEGELAAAKAAAPAEDPVARQVHEVSRALVLAQEAADKTVAEAKAEADKTVAEARAEADKSVAEARAEAERSRTEARTEAESMLSDARRELEQRMASMDADIDAHAAERRAEREEEIARLAALEQRRRAELQRLEEQFQNQRERLSAVAAAASLLMEEHKLDPVPASAPEPAAADPERTALFETVRPDTAPSGSTAGSEGHQAPDTKAEAPRDEASRAEAPPDEANGTGAIAADVVETAAQAEATGDDVAEVDAGERQAEEAEGDSEGEPADTTGSGGAPTSDGTAVSGIPPSPPPRLEGSGNPAPGGQTTDRQAPDTSDVASTPSEMVPTAQGSVSADPAAEAGPTWRQSASSAVDEGSTFWRPPGGERGLFDQDDGPVAPPTPHLRSVAPPDDDPFLAALRGDDQAAAMLHDQDPEDNPTGFMRLLRRR